MSGEVQTSAPSNTCLGTVTPDDLRALVARSPCIGARLVESAARQGIVTAQTTFARMLLVGQAVPRDPAKAFDWFRIAADAGDADALNMLGRCHEHGWGVPTDRKRAIACYRAAARQGFVWAQHNLGQVLISGARTPAQRREGLGWHLVAAKSGNAKSMNVVGRFCEEGWEMPRNFANALGWYRKAAESGDYWGQFNLGRLLAEDGETEEAARWLRKAAACGNDAFTAAIGPVLMARPEEELQAIGRMIAERQQTEAAPAQTGSGHRRRAKAGWFQRTVTSLSAS